MQRRYPLILALSCLCASPAHPQKGTAPDGYYPPSYNGSTFTGAVESPTPANSPCFTEATASESDLSAG